MAPVNAGSPGSRAVLPALTAYVAVNAGSASDLPALPALTGSTGPAPSMPAVRQPRPRNRNPLALVEGMVVGRPLEENELVERARAGDADAYAALVRGHEEIAF